MLNLRVDNLDAVLEKLRTAGALIDPKREDHDYGRFAWFHDPEGNRVELWQPPPPGAD
jgi:predicted enzyme related to lactoylglutathione lyase